MKNHTAKNHPNLKKRSVKEPEIVQKKLNMVLRERSNAERFVSTAGNVVEIKEEFILPTKSDSHQLDTAIHNTNSIGGDIDLMDISKCIMGIESEKAEYNDYDCMNFDNDNVTTDEYSNIEAIKKYLTDLPAEYIDLNSLHTVKQEYFPSF